MIGHFSNKAVQSPLQYIIKKQRNKQLKNYNFSKCRHLHIKMLVSVSLITVQVYVFVHLCDQFPKNATEKEMYNISITSFEGNLDFC